MANDEWRTPPALFRLMNDRHSFTVDAASTHHNALCERHITAEDDALAVHWGSGEDVAWCNPPYSSGMISAFLRKGIEEVNHGCLREAVFLIRADVSTLYWHELAVAYGAEILFPDGRVNFLTPDGQADRGSGTKGARSPNFASAIVVFRRRVEGVNVPITYGTVSYDRGKRYGADEGPDRLPGETTFRRRIEVPNA